MPYEQKVGDKWQMMYGICVDDVCHLVMPTSWCPQQSLPQMTPTDSDDYEDNDDKVPIPPQERQQSQPQQQQQQSIQILIQRERNKSKTGQHTDTSHHTVYYGRGHIWEQRTGIKGLKPVGLAKALEHALGLVIPDVSDKTQESAWVVFYNQQTLESFGALRTKLDNWQLSMPAYESDINVCDTY